MDRDLVILGIVFIVVGAIAFFMGESMSHSFQYYQMAPMMNMVGIAGLIAGFIISIVGASTEKKKEKLRKTFNKVFMV